MINRLALNLILLLILFCSNVLFSQTNILSVDNRIKFANHLFNENDFLRAFEEYRFAAEKSDNDTIVFKIAECFRNMRRFSEAKDAYKSISFNSPLEEVSRLFYYRTAFENKDYELIKKIDKEDFLYPMKFEKEISTIKSLSYLLSDGYMPDKEDFVTTFPKPLREKFAEFYDFKIHPPKKSPLKAALLSAVVPGLGKVYTGNYSDGITSFIFTGLLTYLAYDNFQSDHQFRAYTFSALAGYFYAGNIYGSAAAAHIHNAKIKMEFRTSIENIIKLNDLFLPKVELW